MIIPRFFSQYLGCFFLVCASAIVSAQTPSATAQFKEFSQNVKVLQGSFVQTSQNNGRRQKSEGVFAFVRPGKFRWEVKKPFPNIITSDGKLVRQYDPDLNQMTVKKLSDTVGVSPAQILFGKGSLDASFTLRDLPDMIVNDLAWLEAAPKTPDPGFKLLKVGMRNGQIMQVRILDTFDQESEIIFSGFIVNETIPPATFTIQVPKGTDIVEFTE